MADAWLETAGIALDPRADVPIGVQLDWSLRAAVADGRLRPGERLPALRDLADELGVNHNTVRAAVARLEAAGVLERRHGSGTFVAADAVVHQRHAPLVEEVARRATEAGLSHRDVAAALYVRGAETPDRGDADVERRALRDEIDLLERLLAEYEARVRPRVPVEPSGVRPGPRLLTTEDLRAERDALVRRLAAAAARDDEGGAGDGGAASAEASDERPPATDPAPRAAPARRAPRPAVPRPQPT